MNDQLQAFIENGRYLPCFFDTLFGLRINTGRLLPVSLHRLNQIAHFTSMGPELRDDVRLSGWFINE